MQALADEPLTLQGLKHAVHPDDRIVELKATLRSFGAANEELERVVSRLCVLGTLIEANWSVLSDGTTALVGSEETASARLPAINAAT